MRRPSRRLIAILPVFGLLFSQGVMATHACKVQFDSLGGLVPAANTSASMQDCADAMDITAATLCLKHCAQGADSNNTVSTADVPSLVLTAFLVVGPAATQLPTES